jgi:NADP-reducing hydrogenase subunit HndD
MSKPVEAALDDETKHVVVQTAPAIRAALGEEFNLPPGTLVTGQMTTALRRLGFDGVFDTDFTADLTIIEEGTELLTRLKTVLQDGGEAKLPMFTSCSPGWIQYAEYYWPDMLDHLSTCKSPQQMFGALAKTYYAGKAKVDAKDMVVVSIMPCTAKKFEAAREEMNSSGYPDVDYVLTTRETRFSDQTSGPSPAGLGKKVKWMRRWASLRERRTSSPTPAVSWKRLSGRSGKSSPARPFRWKTSTSNR